MSKDNGAKNVYNNFFDLEIWEKVNPENQALLEDYLLELKQNQKSDGTIYQYKRDLMGLMVYIYRKLDNRSILELSKRDFRSYSLYLSIECGLANASHNRRLSSLRSLLSFAEEEDDTYDYDVNAARKVKSLPKHATREIHYLSDEQILMLRDALMKRGECQKATLLMLAYDSAGRKNELSQVEKHCFLDDSKNSTNKVIGKRRKIFRLVYFSGTKECAKKWLSVRGDDEIDSLWAVNGKGIPSSMLYDWFMDMRDLLYEISGDYIEFNVHSMRHACLQNFSDGTHYVLKELGMTEGFPIEKLKLLANHSSIETTSQYLRDNSIDELREMFGITIDD